MSIEEKKRYITAEFPMEVYHIQYADYADKNVELHQHRELEIVYILKGKVFARVNGTEMFLSKGEVLIINSEIFHTYQAASEDAIQLCIVFSPFFLANSGSDIYQKYILPFVSDEKFVFYRINEECTVSEFQIQMVYTVEQISKLFDNKEEGYELQAYMYLCQFWYLLFRSKISVPQNKENKRYSERMQNLLEYIRTNYDNEITIDDLAKAANVSRSECFRCFQKTLHQRPSEYINNYRLEKAANMLRNTEYSVSQICCACGINHQSYFGQMFKQRYGTSPLNYRKIAYCIHDINY